MATDQYLLNRIERILERSNASWMEKKMFGGICLMVDGKMCIGYNKHGLLVRIDPEESETLVKKRGADFMLHGGKAQPGYLYIQPTGYDAEEDLEFWVYKCLQFNPKAKASKK